MSLISEVYIQKSDSGSQQVFGKTGDLLFSKQRKITSFSKFKNKMRLQLKEFLLAGGQNS